MSTTDFNWARNAGHGEFEDTVLNTDTGDFALYQVLKMDSVNVLSGTPYLTAPGALVAGAAAYPIGVAITKAAHVSAAPYIPCRVQFGGRCPVLASAAITAGAILATAASGKVATQTSAQPQVGQALTAAASSTDILLAQLQFANNA